MGQLFVKTWVSLWIVLMVTYVVTVVLVEQMRAVNDEYQARSRPWQLIERLALEAERYVDNGGDIADWGASDAARRFGQTFVLDSNGAEVNGRHLPAGLAQTQLRPFVRGERTDAAVSGAVQERSRWGLARTIFPRGAIEPYTLVLLPNRIPASAWAIPPMWLLLMVGALFAAVAAWLFCKHLLPPIRALRLASESVASGNFSARPGVAMGRRADELAQLAHHFDRMSERLALATEQQKGLLRDVSHELRTPLARLQIALDILREHQEPTSPTLMDRMQAEVHQLDSLINEILLLSRIDEQAGSTELVKVDLVVLLQQVCKDLEFQFLLPDGTLQLHTPAHAWCAGDELLLHRALENVVGNALKYAPRGTEITVSLMTQAGRWEVVVEDQGPGVKAAELEAIFEPFYRGQTEQRQQGHGLGLAMVKKILQAHGGSVTAKNLAPCGFQMLLTMPQVQPCP